MPPDCLEAKHYITAHYEDMKGDTECAQKVTLPLRDCMMHYVS